MATHPGADRNLIWRAIAENPGAWAQTLRLVSASVDSYLCLGLAKNPSTPKDVLQELWKDGRFWIRKALEQRSASPGSDEEGPSASEASSNLPGPEPAQGESGYEIASDPGTLPDDLLQLSRSSDVSVRLAVARNPSTPASVLETMVADVDPIVRLALALSPQICLELRKKLEEDSDLQVRATASRPWDALLIAQESAGKLQVPRPLQRLKEEAESALGRTIASQLGLLVREVFLGMSSHLSGENRQKTNDFLKSDLGKGLSLATLSTGLWLLGDRLPEAWRIPVAHLERETRIGALAAVGGELVELVTGPLRQLGMGAWKGQEMVEGEGVFSEDSTVVEDVALEEEVPA
jgi:hypothetical protein